MEALHARYPFLSAAREAVEATDVDLATAIEREERVVERARERVRLAIETGGVGETHRSPRVEVLSYPVARVLVSLIDEPGLHHRYARAEAETAFERFREDEATDDDLRSVERATLDRDALLSEFDLAGRVEPTNGEVPTSEAEAFRVEVTAYLDLAGELDGEGWRLPTRALANGWVRVTREELDDLLREAIRERIETGLPLDVPGPIADELADAVAEVRSLLADLDLAWDIDAVEPDRFPPCIDALLDRVDAGEPLESHSQFALVTFLATAGMETERIARRLAAHPDLTREEVEDRVAHLREDDGAAAYPPPSCSTMQAYGDCVNADALCERIAHPLDYYERRLRGDDPTNYE